MHVTVHNRSLLRGLVATVIAFAFALPWPARAMTPPTAAGRAAAAKSEVSLPASPEVPADEPVVRITPPASADARRAIFFPLRIPSYALRAATLPIGMLFKLIERKQVVQRVADALSNKEKTMWAYPIVEGGAGSGFGGGMGLTHTDLFHENYNLKLRYTAHINMNMDASAAFGRPLAFRIAGTPVSWATAVHWMRLTNENYYGIGPTTTQGNDSAYLINRTIVGGALAFELIEDLSFNFGAAYDVAGTGPNTYGSLPSVGQTFPAGQRIGYSDWLHYVVFDAKLQYDSRDNLSMPSRGGLYSFSIKRYQHIGRGDFDFFQEELDARHFFPIGSPRIVLALHAGLLLQQTTGGSEIPFYRLATLDVNTPLRGFTQGRFHDHNLFILNAEYRFPVWNSIDGVFFVDTGRVFHRIQDFTVKDFRYSVGGGLRLSALGLMLLRFDLAYGGEGIVTMVGISRSL